MELNIPNYSGKMRQVACPDCGALGGNKGPCWCHECHKDGQKVMMLPSWNGFIHANWCEVGENV